MYTRTLHIYTAILSAFVFILPTLVAASGLSVTPSKLVIDTGDKTTSTTLVVKNISNDDSLFEIYSDDMEKLFNIHPDSFMLKSGQSRKVKINVYPHSMSLAQTNISVVSQPVMDQGFTFGSGIKIPVTVYAGKANADLLASLLFVTPITKVMLLILVGLVILAFLILISKKIRKRTRC